MAPFAADAVGSFLSTWFLAWLLGLAMARRVPSPWLRTILAVLLAWVIGGAVAGFMEGENGFQARFGHMLTLEMLWYRAPGAGLYLIFALVRLAMSKGKGTAPPAAQA